MTRQAFREAREPIPGGNLATVTSISGEALAWAVSPWTALAAYEAKPGQVWKLTAGGVMTTVTSPGNLTITPRVGTSTSGISLGASPATALTASITNAPWYMQAILVNRGPNISTATWTLAGTFECQQTLARDMVFGGTIATADPTIATGLAIGLTHTVATVTYTPQFVIFEPAN